VLHERAGCRCGCGGSWQESQARAELGNLQARVRAGVWERSSAVRPSDVLPFLDPPSFRDYSRWWLAAKVEGTISSNPIARSTARDYHRSIENHLMPFFGSYRLDEISEDLCQRFKAEKLRMAAEQRAAIDAGAVLRDERRRRIFPLGAASIHKLIAVLAAILDDAVEDKYMLRNPARVKRMRVHVPKPKRSFLEIDELVSLFEAAAKQDQILPSTVPSDRGPTAAAIAALIATDKEPSQIARELGLAPSTVTYHLRKLGAVRAGRYRGRQAIVETLGRTGVRVSELCDLRIGQVRIYNPRTARFFIQDAKTEPGIREVQLTPGLTQTLANHLERLARSSRPTGPEAYLMPNRAGGRSSRQRIARIVRDAALLATEERATLGLPPLPHTTPHTLRRTYISIALLANGFDIKWVMHQVGHADSRMTLDVYAQLEQRVNRQHGIKFDQLVPTRPANVDSGDEKATGGTNRTSTTNRNVSITTNQSAISRRKARWRDRDSNPGHHDFQSCALPTELSRR
jgi:integrase